MPPTNRRDVLADSEAQVVHCVNRCVRRAFLCGQDSLTGTDHEHRCELIRQRLGFLAGIMGFEVIGYSVCASVDGTAVSQHIGCSKRRMMAVPLSFTISVSQFILRQRQDRLFATSRVARWFGNVFARNDRRE